jgi:hypothetical protein
MKIMHPSYRRSIRQVVCRVSARVAPSPLDAPTAGWTTVSVRAGGVSESTARLPANSA